MDHHLVAKQVEVHPVVAAAAFFAPEYLPVKGAAFFEVVNGDGDVKGRDGMHGLLYFISRKNTKLNAENPFMGRVFVSALQEIHDFLDFLFRAFKTRNVLEGSANLGILIKDFCL